MPKFSDNYNLRKFYLEHDQVPSQSMMREKMSPALAAVYFKSMGPRYKVLAGLEPPMKGGGCDWLVCPTTVMKGKTVLKPIHHEHLIRMNHIGVAELGTVAHQVHKKNILAEKAKIQADSDSKWKEFLREAHIEHWQTMTDKCENENAEYVRELFNQFADAYQTSTNRIEQLLSDAAETQIAKIRAETREQMNQRYKDFLKYQSVTIMDRHRKQFHDEKARLKSKFMEDVEAEKAATANTIHSLHVDKHEAIANLRKFLECQNLACQIYVSLKEQETYDKQIELCKYQHNKKLKTLTEELAVKELTIKLAAEIQKKHKEEHEKLRQRLCKIVKKFQIFVSYCLNTLPEHAKFFINLEKLILLQINETLQDPRADSIILEEPDEFHAPVPRPRPFYLFCDKGYKAQVDESMCPSKRGSDVSQLPVIVVNQRCMYAACDNLVQFTDKFKNHLFHKRGDDADFIDDLRYEHCVPVKYTNSQQVTEIKLQSSLLQILQQEALCRKNVFNCEVCKMPCCYCTTPKTQEIQTKEAPVKLKTSNKTLPVAGRSTILEHEREPKLERYFKYVKPQKCTCGKMVKKHLKENLPAYMTSTSKYETLELQNYEKCPVTTLKRLVKKANYQVEYSPPVPEVISRTKDASTQYSDVQFEWLCNCFSNSEVDLLLKDYMIGQKPDPKSEESSGMTVQPVSASFLQQTASSFATDRAESMRQLLNNSPEVEELFVRKKK